jgi:copper chaperone CopZ
MKIAAALFALCLGSAALAAQKTETMKVKGWKCDKCPPKTAAKVKEVKGVSAATADRARGELTVTYDDSQAKHADLEQAVASSGFAVEK